MSNNTLDETLDERVAATIIEICTKQCRQCFSEIDARANRCPNCGKPPGETKQCPFCCEPIEVEATACPDCGQVMGHIIHVPSLEWRWYHWPEIILEKFFHWVRRGALFDVLDYASRLAIIVAVVFWFLGIEQRREQEVLNAWQLISIANQVGGGDATTSALETLNCSKRIFLCSSRSFRKGDLGDLIAPGVNLQNANLAEANLRGAYLGSSNLSGALFWRADLSGANLFDANLSKANLAEANLNGVDLRFTDLREIELAGASLVDANLSGVDLTGTSLNGINLSGADLSAANLSGVDLGHARLIGADLTGANLNGAILAWADLTGANLSNADLKNTHLGWSQLQGTDLRGALYTEGTIWPINFDPQFIGNNIGQGRWDDESQKWVPVDGE